MARAADRYRLPAEQRYYSMRIRRGTAMLLCRAAVRLGMPMALSWDARLFQFGELVMNNDRELRRIRGRRA